MSTVAPRKKRASPMSEFYEMTADQVGQAPKSVRNQVSIGNMLVAVLGDARALEIAKSRLGSRRAFEAIMRIYRYEGQDAAIAFCEAHKDTGLPQSHTARADTRLHKASKLVDGMTYVERVKLLRKLIPLIEAEIPEAEAEDDPS